MAAHGRKRWFSRIVEVERVGLGGQFDFPAATAQKLHREKAPHAEQGREHPYIKMKHEIGPQRLDLLQAHNLWKIVQRKEAEQKETHISPAGMEKLFTVAKAEHDLRQAAERINYLRTVLNSGKEIDLAIPPGFKTVHTGGQKKTRIVNIDSARDKFKISIPVLSSLPIVSPVGHILGWVATGIANAVTFTRRKKQSIRQVRENDERKLVSQFNELKAKYLELKKGINYEQLLEDYGKELKEYQEFRKTKAKTVGLQTRAPYDYPEKKAA